MRPLNLVMTLIVLHALDAAAAGLVVQPSITRLVATTEQLVDTCATNGKYDACTRFIAFRLETSCLPDGAEWRIDGNATFRPWVLLKNMQRLPHEQEHIRDVRASALRYVDELSARRYASAADCEEDAFRERTSFGQRLRGFALESNLARHPVLRAAALRLYDKP